MWPLSEYFWTLSNHVLGGSIVLYSTLLSFSCSECSPFGANFEMSWITFGGLSRQHMNASSQMSVRRKCPGPIVSIVVLWIAAERKCVDFFFLSVNLICSRPYWCQYMHMFVHIFHFFNSSSDYLHAFLPAVWLTKNPCKVWYCWKIKSKSISRSLFVLFMKMLFSTNTFCYKGLSSTLMHIVWFILYVLPDVILTRCMDCRRSGHDILFLSPLLKNTGMRTNETKNTRSVLFKTRRPWRKSTSMRLYNILLEVNFIYILYGMMAFYVESLEADDEEERWMGAETGRP